MEKKFEFEEINEQEKRLLLSAFDFEVDADGNIIDSLLQEKVISHSTGKPFTLQNVTFVQGSLKLIDSDPLTISRFLREDLKNDRP